MTPAPNFAEIARDFLGVSFTHTILLSDIKVRLSELETIKIKLSDMDALLSDIPQNYPSDAYQSYPHTANPSLSDYLLYPNFNPTCSLSMSVSPDEGEITEGSEVQEDNKPIAALIEKQSDHKSWSEKDAVIVDTEMIGRPADRQCGKKSWSEKDAVIVARKERKQLAKPSNQEKSKRRNSQRRNSKQELKKIDRMPKSSAYEVLKDAEGMVEEIADTSSAKSVQHGEKSGYKSPSPPRVDKSNKQESASDESEIRSISNPRSGTPRRGSSSKTARLKRDKMEADSSTLARRTPLSGSPSPSPPAMRGSLGSTRTVSRRENSKPQQPTEAYGGSTIYKQREREAIETTQGLSPSPQPHTAGSLESSGRFASTLRQIVHGDIMAEVSKIVKRIDKLESSTAQSGARTVTQVIDFIPETENIMLDNLQRKISDLSYEMGKRMEDVDQDINMIMETNYEGGNAIEVTNRAVKDLQMQLRGIRNLSARLQTENETKTKIIQDLYAEMMKLGRQKVEKVMFDAELEAKSEKADLEMKVDKLEFVTVTEELQGLVDDILDKLLTLEGTWIKAHTNLEAQIHSKSDPEEIHKLKQKINRRLRDLNYKVKHQQALAQTPIDTAAALRRRLPFNCLSCDRPIAWEASDMDGNLVNCTQNNMKAYLVHFGKKTDPRVFITRSKTRMVSPDPEDLYFKPRACGGKHTITQDKTQGQAVLNGKALSLKDVLDGETVVAAGKLRSDEYSVMGQDGRTYRTRSDRVEVDPKLTRALHVARDPIMPLVDDIKLSKNNSAQTRDPRLNKRHVPKKAPIKRDTNTAPAKLQ